MKFLFFIIKSSAIVFFGALFWAGQDSNHVPLNREKTIIEHSSGSDAYFLRENKGQWPEQVLYQYNGGSKVLYLEKGGLLWHVSDPNLDGSRCGHDHQCKEHDHEKRIREHVYKTKFIGARPEFKSEGINSSPWYSNYFIGSDQSKWASKVRDFTEVKMSRIYDRIDLRFYQDAKGMKYDWIVQPGGNPNDILLEYQFLDRLFLKRGKLYQVNSIDTIIEDAPFSYQMINGKKKEVKSKYIIRNKNQVSFQLGKYNKNYPLIIDPRLVFSTYTNSSADNWGSTATPGSDGSFYAGGVAFGAGYPTFNGSFDSRYNPTSRPPMTGDGVTTDIAISKFSPDGSNMIYSTYLGGEESEFVHSLIENSRGELVIYGTTSSTDYPTTRNAAISNFRGGARVRLNGIDYFNGSDIIVSVLSSDGSNLVGSTYMGAESNDGVNNRVELAYNYGDQFRGEVIVDESDNIYVASSTQSANFPTTNGVVSPNKSDDQDGCIFSLNRTCSTLRFSSFFGGNGIDAVYSLKRNSGGQIIVTGGTTSTDLRTVNPLSSNYNGGQADGYIALFSDGLTTLLASTYLGTSEYDQGYFVSLDLDDQIYIAGQSNGNMPISGGAYGIRNSGQFIHIYEPDLSARTRATTFGTGSGEVDISLTALNVDFCKRIFLSGWGGVTNSFGVPSSTTFGLPITIDAHQSSTDGSDFYFIVLEKDFTSLIYGTYFGRFNTDPNNFSNDHVDGGTSRFAEDGTIYQAVCAGCGGFSDFPTSSGAYSNVNGSQNCNLAAVKFDFELNDIVAAADLVLDTFGCAPYNAEFINLSRGADSYYWIFGDGDTSTLYSPSHQYDSIGIYQVQMIAKSSFDCLDPDTLDLTINIIAAEPPNVDTILECDRNFVILESSRSNNNSRYIWEDGITTSKGKRVLETGVYAVSASESNCIYIDSFFVTIIDPEVDLRDSIICGFNPFDIELDPRAKDINWSTGSTDLSIRIDRTGLYSVNYFIEDCYFEDTAYYSFATVPDIEIIGDTVICGSAPLTLEVIDQSNANISSFEWSSGEKGVSIDVINPGNYSVTVSSDSACVDVASVDVIKIEELPELISGDSLICNESELVVDFSEFADFSEIMWDDGNSQPVRSFSKPGTYSYTISNFCETKNGVFDLAVSPFRSDDQPIYIPNAFTPNEDNNNDVFKPELAEEITILDYRMMIFDRWGNKIFESQDINIGWDGTFKGEIMDPAIFAYVFEIEYFICEAPKKVILDGDLNLQK